MCTCQENNALTSNAEKWMQHAVKNPGEFTAYAKGNGGLGSDGKINLEWARKIADDESKTPHVRRMANLYLTFMKSK